MTILVQQDELHPTEVRHVAILRIQKSSRGFIVRRTYNRKKIAVKSIQRQCRRNQHKLSHQFSRIGDMNVSLVKRLIVELEDGRLSLLRTMFTHDFEYERVIGKHRVKLTSLQKFLQSPFGRRPLPKPSVVFSSLKYIGHGVVMREVRFALTNVKESFHIRRYASGRPPLISRHSTIELDEEPEPERGEGDLETGPKGDRASEAARRDLTSLDSLRRSFAVLDVDGSGGLSLRELRQAMHSCNMHRLREHLNEAELKDQLKGLSFDVHGGFHLTNLEKVLEQDAVLNASGIEYERPLLFDVLPLVSRTFDAHRTVETCLREQAELDRRREHEHLLALRRIHSSKKQMANMVRSPLMRIVSQPSTNKWAVGHGAPAAAPVRASHFVPIAQPDPSGGKNPTARERGLADKRSGRLPPIHVPGVRGLAPMRYACVNQLQDHTRATAPPPGGNPETAGAHPARRRLGASQSLPEIPSRRAHAHAV